MRSAMIALALAACTPEIASGTYECGVERDCPEGQACDGVTNVCVLPSAVEPFSCGEDIDEVEPNDAFATAQAIPTSACVSQVSQVIGCTGGDGNREDWFSFSVPANCSAVDATARLAFPLAFELPALELRDDAGGVRAMGVACANDAPSDGTGLLCVDAPVTAGGRFAIRVAGSGTLDCDGECAFNRYVLTMQLAAP